jgi:hypothetical protein
MVQTPLGENAVADESCVDIGGAPVDCVIVGRAGGNERPSFRCHAVRDGRGGRGATRWCALVGRACAARRREEDP